MKHAFSTRWSKNPNWGRSHFSHHFQSSYVLFISKRRFSCSLNGNMGPPISLFKTCLFGVRSWSHAKPHTRQYRRPNKNSNWIRIVHLTWSPTWHVSGSTGICIKPTSKRWVQPNIGRVGHFKILKTFIYYNFFCRKGHMNRMVVK